MNCDFCSSSKNVKSYTKYHRHFGVKRTQNTVYKSGKQPTKITTYNILGEFTPNLCPKCYKKYFRRNIVSFLLTSLIIMVLLILMTIVAGNIFDLSITLLGGIAAIGFIGFAVLNTVVRNVGKRVFGGEMSILDQYEESILKPQYGVKTLTLFTDEQYSCLK